VETSIPPQGEAPPIWPDSSDPALQLTFSEDKESVPLRQLLDAYKVEETLVNAGVEGESPVEFGDYWNVDEFIWPKNSYHRVLPAGYLG
jgi:hypothetical protein